MIALGTAKATDCARRIHASPIVGSSGGGGSRRHCAGNACRSTIATRRSPNSHGMRTNDPSRVARSRCTAISSAANERVLATYTTRWPGELQRPPNRRAPSPSKALTAYRFLTIRQAVRNYVKTPCSRRPISRSTSSAPTSVFATVNGTSPPNALCGSDNQVLAASRFPSNKPSARAKTREALRRRSDSSW
jgi:hypothetical protein